MQNLPKALQFSRQHTVALGNFEGPLDLLLYLIERNELPIEAVALTLITKPYLESLEALQSGIADAHSAPLAGEFFVMAATLMLIKSRRLLPVQVEEDLLAEDDGGSDPTFGLIEQLVQYKAMKDQSRRLQALWVSQEAKLGRAFLPQLKEVVLDKHRSLAPISPRRLRDLWRQLEERLAQKALFEHFGEAAVTIGEQMDWLLGLLRDQPRVWMQGLFRSEPVSFAHSTLLASLELTRQQKASLEQSENFAPLWVASR